MVFLINLCLTELAAPPSTCSSQSLHSDGNLLWLNALKSLDPNKSCVSDEIPGCLLKSTASEMTPVCKLVLVAQLGAVRANWKRSDVSPVKPGRPSLPIQRTLLDRSPPLGTSRGNEKRLSRRGAKEDGCICRISTTPPWLWIIAGLSVPPFKIDQNRNQNRLIDEVQILGNERRYIYKDPRQDSGQRNISCTRYPKKRFTQTYRDLYGDAILVITWMSSNMADGNQQKHLLPSFATKAWIYSSRNS